MTGEVRFPGRYTLLSKTARVSDVVRRARGLTGAPHADRIVLNAHPEKRIEQRTVRKQATA